MMIAFSPALWTDLKVIRSFLFTRMYRAPSVVDVRVQVSKVVEQLFTHYMAHPEMLPRSWEHAIASAKDEQARARSVSDYISGMTDRFAIQDYERLGFGDVHVPPR
jgi:dGTPase